jgi:hypothetical protein
MQDLELLVIILSKAKRKLIVCVEEYAKHCKQQVKREKLAFNFGILLGGLGVFSPSIYCYQSGTTRERHQGGRLIKLLTVQKLTA